MTLNTCTLKILDTFYKLHSIYNIKLMDSFLITQGPAFAWLSPTPSISNTGLVITALGYY